jgi:hypothetical protein
MHAAYVTVLTITMLATAAVVVADISRTRFALANADEVQVPRSWVPLLGALKAAGAAGLLLGCLGAHLLGLAAAAGLVAFFVCAVAAHIRAGVFYNIAFPGLFLALATGSLALAVHVWT